MRVIADVSVHLPHAAVQTMNPFLNTRKLTERKEDHLSEFLAGALEIDTQFSNAYAQSVLGAFAARNDWQTPAIASVETQRSFVEHRSRPDMFLKLRDGHLIACEHKLDAVETVLSVDYDSEDPTTQLLRYLSIPGVDGVVYVRTSLRPPDRAVLEHSRYVRPSHRQHFLWRDFYPLLGESTHTYASWLREGFEVLGFTPPHPFVGDLSDPANRQNFAKLWSPTRARSHELGWRVTTGNVAELYLERDADLVWISPWNEQLLFRVTPRAGGDITDLIARLESVALQRPPDSIVIEKRAVRRAAGRAEVVDIFSPLNKVLGLSMTAEAAESRLWAFVEPLLLAIN